jgi:hypothetical protein
MRFEKTAKISKNAKFYFQKALKNEFFKSKGLPKSTKN